MMKRFRSRALSFMLVFVLLFTMVPLTVVQAADRGDAFDVDGITLSKIPEGSDTKVTGSDSFRVSATGEIDYLSYISGTDSVTMTVARSASRRILSFSYYPHFSSNTNRAGSVMIGNEEVFSAATYTHTIPANTDFSLTISVSTFEGTDTTSVDIENIILDKSVSDAEFHVYSGLWEEMDEYSYEFGYATGYYTNSSSPEEDCDFYGITTGVTSITITAIPDDEAEFVAFVDYKTRAVLSNDPEFVFIPSYDGQMVSALFMPASLPANSSDANFAVGSYYCATFEEAVLYARYAANRVITVAKSEYTLEPGEYVIPRNVTLLVPFDDGHTMYTTSPDDTTNKLATTTENCYSNLILDEGAMIIVEDGGAISVSARHPAANQSHSEYNGAVTGQYGQITMLNNSRISLEPGSSLYAWGFIIGDGVIDAMNGSSVYEYFQIYDYRGGNVTANMASSTNNQFFFNQYYVQNIEAELCVYYGATEYVLMDLTFESTNSISVIRAFIGENGAFQLESDDAYISKRYAPDEDLMYYDFFGVASLHTISISAMGITISTDGFYLPINNIVVTVHEGSVMNMEKKVLFLPGSGVVVEEGASIDISGTGSVVFADKDDETIKKYSNVVGRGLGVPFKPVAFSPTRTATRQWEKTENSYLNNDGNVTVNDQGTLTSTSGDDAFMGDGTYEFNSTAEPPRLKYYTSSLNTATETTEPIELTNDDGSQIDTEIHWTIPAVFSKVNGVWGDYRTVSVYNWDESELLASSDVAITCDGFDALVDGQPTPQKPDDVGYTYTYSGEWEIITTGTHATTTDHISYRPKFDSAPRTYTLHWYDEDGQWIKDSNETYGLYPEGAPSLSKESTAAYNYVLNWKDSEDNVYSWDDLPMVTGEETYTASFKANARKYTVTWKHYNGDSLGTTSCAYGASPTPNKNPSKKPTDGTLYGWMNMDTREIYPVSGTYNRVTLPAVTGEITYMAVYSLPVTWYDGETQLGDATTVYTECAPVPAAAYQTLPEKDGNKFIGWTTDDGAHVYDSASIPVLTGTISGAVAYYAVYENSVAGKYLILNGEIVETVVFNPSVTVNHATLSYEVTETKVTKGAEYTADEISGANNRVSVKMAPAEMTYGITVNYSTDDGDQRTFKTSGAAYADSLFASSEVADAPQDGHYYLVGTINGNNCWADNIRTCYELKPNPNFDGEYLLEHVLLYAGDQFKIICYNYDGNGNNYWYGDTNAEIQETGTKTIYFRPSGNSSWSHHYYFHVVNDTATQENDQLIEYNKAKNVTSALMNYATAAQLYFGRNIGDLANSHVNGNVYTFNADETDERIAAFDAEHVNTMPQLKAGASLGGALSANYGLTYYQSSLTLNAGVVVRHYFLVTDASLVPDTVTFSSGSRTNVVAEKHVYKDPRIVYYDYVCEGDGIPGAELGNTITINFSGDGKQAVSGDYNVFNYVKLALNSVASAENPTEKQLRLVEMLRAMYWYYIESAAYFSL